MIFQRITIAQVALLAAACGTNPTASKPIASPATTANGPALLPAACAANQRAHVGAIVTIQ